MASRRAFRDPQESTSSFSFNHFIASCTSTFPGLFDLIPFIEVTKLVSMLKFTLGAGDVMHVLPLEEL